MRIQVIQFTPALRGRPTPRFDPQLGTLLALLRSRDHELQLLSMSRFDQQLIRTTLDRWDPELVYADIAGVCSDLARRTLGAIQEDDRRRMLPIVAGGVFPTVDPSGSLSLPGVRAVAIGEPDATLVTWLERMNDPTRSVVLGVWLRSERGLALPKMPSLVEDLDSLPFAERDLFNYASQVRANATIDVAVGRGCPQRCAYCVNDGVSKLYTDDDQQWVRRRSPENILDEIDAVRARCQPVRLVRFLDHAFALDPDWLDEFLGVYVFRCALPFRCHLRLNAADMDVIRLLDDAACQMADVEVISGSDFIRNEIFQMDLSNGDIEDAFQRLHHTRIRSRAIVYVGSPYDSDASLDDTLALLRKLRPDCADVRPYYPFPGTEALSTCRENGWLHARGEEQYHNDRAGIDMPAFRPDRVAAFVRRLRRELPTSIGVPWWRRWSHGVGAALDGFLGRRNQK